MNRQQSDRFKQQLRDSLQCETLNARTVNIARHANVYTCGDQDEMVYFIESGQVKLLMLSADGKACLRHDSLLEGYVRYLAVRIADQQQIIADLVTADSEQRLGKTLLQLARTLGKNEPQGIRIETKISHDELSEMVGTTRPRISMFMERFRKHGLLERNRENFLVVREKKLTDYLAVRAAGYVCARPFDACQSRPVLDSNHLRAGVS